MGAEFLIYSILYLITIGGAVMVIASREPVRAAMALVLVMLSLAGHYFYLGQEFVGAIQIIVYAGAIMVLFLFVIMLLNVREREVAPWYMRNVRFWGGALALLFFVLLAAGINIFAGGTVVSSAHAGDAPTIPDLVTLLVTKYSLPFLLTSVLLLVAVIGAVVMGRRADPETGEEYRLDESEVA